MFSGVLFNLCCAFRGVRVRWLSLQVLMIFM